MSSQSRPLTLAKASLVRAWPVEKYPEAIFASISTLIGIIESVVRGLRDDLVDKTLPGVGRDHFVRNSDSLNDGNAGTNNSVMFLGNTSHYTL